MPRSQESAMKLVDADVTHADRSPPALDVSGDADTHASPGLRPEVLADAAQRQTKALVHAALFKTAGEASTIGPYQVLKLLGEGGMGVVYAAYDDQLERKVALKLIRGAAMRRPEGRARTLREARALARLSHPNVVHVYQVGEVDDEIYVAMEFLTGPTLRAWLNARPRTWREVLAVFRQAGDGLAAAHRQGVIHRDFKPANVIVGDDGRVRVLDFGLAHFGAEGEPGERRALLFTGEITDVLLTQTGAVLGTPAYMAAEQFTGGRGDAKTDQFSFCTALYEALYGQRPFAGDKLDALASAVIDGRVLPVKRRHDVPPWLHRVVTRGLQPDPAARWPSMDALLVALTPPEARARGARIAGLTGAAGALLIGGLGVVYMLDAPPPAPAADSGRAEAEAEAAARGRAELIKAQDERLLVEARAALATDPPATIRALAQLAGDDPSTWLRARFLADAAAVRGLPTQVLRAGGHTLISVHALAGGGAIGRDNLGGVWQWGVSDRTCAQVMMASASSQLVVARDVPVWATITGGAAQVFGADRAQTIDIGEPSYSGWRLTPDGTTLVATAQIVAPTGTWIATAYLWDLTAPGSPPRTIELAPETLPVMTDDAAIVLASVAKGIRVIHPRGGADRLLKYKGSPWKASADGRFVVALPDDRTGVMDVIEVATGKSRRVEADAVTLLGASDVLFTRMARGRAYVRRESLATGAVAWWLPLPGHAGPLESRLVVDPVHEQFAVALGESWGVGDLRSGELSAFVAVPKDSSPQWLGAGQLMIVAGSEARIYTPAAAPVQVRHTGSSCELSPGGRFAVVMPHDVATGEFTRVDLTTRATATFRCPKPPSTTDRGARFPLADASVAVDDGGQVAMFGTDGWSCWWDAQHGARTGSNTLTGGFLVELPRGVARAQEAEVEVWTGPEERAQRWTAAGAVVDLQASPASERLAVRSDGGVQVLHVDTGAVWTVPTWRAPTGRSELLASALAFSRDGALLAVLDKIGPSLELSVWDVAGEPREVGPENHVTLGAHVLEDSPGRPRNRVTFTPSGAAVAVTHRHESLLLVDLASHATRQLAVPDLFDLRMRSETDAVAIDLQYAPFMLDFAAREVSPLTPNLELGGSTRPPIRGSEDGSTWTCNALGLGTLTEISARDASSPQELRTRLAALASL